MVGTGLGRRVPGVEVPLPRCRRAQDLAGAHQVAARGRPETPSSGPLGESRRRLTGGAVKPHKGPRVGGLDDVGGPVAGDVSDRWGGEESQALQVLAELGQVVAVAGGPGAEPVVHANARARGLSYPGGDVDARRPGLEDLWVRQAAHNLADARRGRELDPRARGPYARC